MKRILISLMIILSSIDAIENQDKNNDSKKLRDAKTLLNCFEELIIISKKKPELLETIINMVDNARKEIEKQEGQNNNNNQN